MKSKHYITSSATLIEIYRVHRGGGIRARVQLKDGRKRSLDLNCTINGWRVSFLSSETQSIGFSPPNSLERSYYLKGEPARLSFRPEK